jgi:subtilisin family serine protease
MDSGTTTGTPGHRRSSHGSARRGLLALPLALLLIVCLAAWPARAQTFDSLVSEAQRAGKVRVLVSGGWEVITGKFGPVDPETVITGASEAQSRQSAFLDDLRQAGVDTRSPYEFRYLPVSVLTLGANDLRSVRQVRPNALVVRDEELGFALAESTGLVGAPKAWAGGYDGSGWMVAVLDSGVDTQHPFLAGQVAREACFSRSCPNGEPAMIGPGAAKPLGNHGTHVAGIVAGRSETMSGVAPGAKIVGIQVFSRVPGGTSSSLGHVLAGLEHVLRLRVEEKLPIAAVNMSLGGGAYAEPCQNQLLKDVAEILLKADVLPVVASGNDSQSNKISIPACVPGMFSVGAIDKAGEVASFSNSASFLDLLAPGVAIRSAIAGGGYKAYPGTSMAAPHVAGAAAILRQRQPDAGAEEIAERLRKGTPVTDPRNGITKPMLLLPAAIGGGGDGGGGSAGTPETPGGGTPGGGSGTPGGGGTPGAAPPPAAPDTPAPGGGGGDDDGWESITG